MRCHNLLLMSQVLNSNNVSGGTCIDLAITNDIFAISDIVITKNFCTVDHHSVSFFLTISVPASSVPTSYGNFLKADWSSINNHLASIIWITTFTACLNPPPIQCLINNPKLFLTLFLVMFQQNSSNLNAISTNRSSENITFVY